VPFTVKLTFNGVFGCALQVVANVALATVCRAAKTTLLPETLPAGVTLLRTGGGKV